MFFPAMKPVKRNKTPTSNESAQEGEDHDQLTKEDMV